MFVIAHGGTSSPRELDDNVKKAVENGVGGESALDVARDVVVGLEDDENFNAGTGSRFRMDGSIQMDAALMTGDHEIGAVSALEKVKNPVKVAEEVYDSPFMMMTGQDVTEFARKKGYQEWDVETEKRREQLKEMRKKLDEKEEYRKFFEELEGSDTVGCVVFCEEEFAAAVSTGGTSFCPRGRVGDSPLVGCGFYAGEYGAVVTTGKGEEIIKKVTAKRCYDLMGEYGLKEACEIAVDEYPDDVSIGLVAVNDEGVASASNREMARYSLVK